MLKNYRKIWISLLLISSALIIGYFFPQMQTSMYNHIKAFSSNELNTDNVADIAPFLQYVKLRKFSPPERKLKDKYIIYKCTRLCGGLADRQKGIISSYILSQMLRRKFGLIMKKGCDFSKFVIPNQVNWTMTDYMLKGKSTEHTRNIDNVSIGVDMRTKDLEKMFSKDVTYYAGNVNYLPFLVNKSSFMSLPWTKNQSNFDIYRIAFVHLFKFAPNTQRRYEEFRARTGNTSLVCAHLRMGKSKTLPLDGKLSFKHPDPVTVIEFLKDKITKSTKLFIATDSDEVRKHVKLAFPEHFIELEGKIVHIDRSGSKFDCSGMEKAILDQFILSTCDTLVISQSGFSIMAAILRGSDDHLYLARLKTVKKSKRLHPFYGFNKLSQWS